MENDGHRGWATTDPFFPTFGADYLYPPSVSNNQGHLAERTMLNAEGARRNNEVVEQVDDQKEEEDYTEDWTRDAFAEDYHGVISLLTEEDAELTETRHFVRHPSRVRGRLNLCRSYGQDCTYLADGPRQTLRPSSSSASLETVSDSSPHQARHPDDKRRNKIQSCAPRHTGQERRSAPRSISRQVQQPARWRPLRSASQDSLSQCAAIPPALRSFVPETPTTNISMHHLRPRGPSSTSVDDGRGYRPDSFSRPANNDSLSVDNEIELQSRKRRRTNSRNDRPDAASSDPGFPRPPASLYGSACQRVRANLIRGSRRNPPATERDRAGLTQLPHASHVPPQMPSQTHDSRASSSLCSSTLTSDPSKIVYMAELIPRRLRRAVLEVFRSYAPYLPLVITTPVTMNNQISMPVRLGRPGRAQSTWVAPLGQDGQGWPALVVPLEVVEDIASYLSRDDLLNLRLSNSELEKKVSRRIFRAVVVPFNPAIYSMSNDNVAKIVLPASKAEDRVINRRKGKETQPVDHNGGSGVNDNRSTPDGMQIFKSWGPHIKQFAMTFEIDEPLMVKPPKKNLFEIIKSWWGAYRWPSPHYSRYASCSNMEKAADETRCMTQALSTLISATEIGLSIDSGLGWIQGPDISDRARFFKRQVKIFKTKYAEPSDEEIDREQVWEGIRQQHFNPLNRTFQTVLVSHPDAVKPVIVWGMSPPNANYPPLIFKGRNVDIPIDPLTMSRIAENRSASRENPFSSEHLVPNALTDGQAQWLLENEWAQRAFLSSYCVSLIDNAATFVHLQSLNIAKLSSRYLSELKREDLWNALPNLERLNLAISPDWRDIIKESTDIVASPAILPSSAASQVYSLLDACIKRCNNITSLDLGWVGGGERAEGIFARNRNILPAPILNFGTEELSLDLRCDILELPHVQHMTLRNCWLHPSALKQFAKTMRGLSLETLKMDSVSLTAVPGKLATAPPANLLGAGGIHGVLHAGLGLGNILIAPHGMVLQGPLDDSYLEQAPGEGPPGGHVNATEDAASYRPPSSSCLNQEQREGSWPEVIDTITPGGTLGHQKYLHGLMDEMQGPPEPRDIGSLRRIEFASCGYIRLTHMEHLDQDPICDVMSKPPYCLLQRAADLKAVMMSGEHDPLLGQIAPAMAKLESDTLQFVWGMRMGWEADDMSKYETREDGQAIGGSGRFSGIVEKDADQPMSG